MFAGNSSASASNRGKRSRSNSSSSSSSSAASSTGGSIFSRLTCTDSASSLSSYSSPADSSAASPGGKEEEVDRPCKILKSDTDSSIKLGPDDSEKSATLEQITRRLSVETETPVLATCGRHYFVDCLVDAAVHMLDIIWYAPLPRALAFVCEESPSTSSIVHDDIIRSTACNVGRTPSQQTIPLELFVRETLRRSKTSCSTLQAALLYCKRAGGEVIRRRAQYEGFTLTAEQLQKLPCAASAYSSLSSTSSPASDDSLLCNRRIFLASVMVSSKFLQDRTYSNRAWSKISGLNVQELSRVERRLLMALEFNLNVSEDRWTSWTDFLKTQWKATRPIARSGMFHSNSAPITQVATMRNVLARSHSLPDRQGGVGGEEIIDADVILPSGDQHAFFANNAAPVLTVSPAALETSDLKFSSTPTLDSVEASLSTPTMPDKVTIEGDATPTSTTVVRPGVDVPRKAGHNLLSAALLNHHLKACS